LSQPPIDRRVLIVDPQLLPGRLWIDDVGEEPIDPRRRRVACRARRPHHGLLILPRRVLAALRRVLAALRRSVALRCALGLRRVLARLTGTLVARVTTRVGCPIVAAWIIPVLGIAFIRRPRPGLLWRRPPASINRLALTVGRQVIAR